MHNLKLCSEKLIGKLILMFLNEFVLRLISIDLNAVICVFFHHHPLKKNVKNRNCNVSPHNYHLFHFVVLRHCLQMVLHKVVYILTKDIHGGCSQNVFVVFFVNDELQKQYQKDIELLKLFPLDSL
jgi:hypothetical protein